MTEQAAKTDDGHRRTPEGEGVRRLKGVGEIGSHAELKEAARDWQRLSSDLIGDVDVRDYKQLPLEVDPPEHGAYRKILDPVFGRGAVLAHEPELRAVARRLTGAFADGGEIEAVHGLAMPMVVHSIGISLGRSQDIPEYLSWGADTWQTLPDGSRDGTLLHAYLDRVFEEVKANPGQDAFSLIATADFEGRQLSHTEMVGLGSILLTGGRDTVISLIAGAIWHLAEADDARTRLGAQPEAIPTAVEELLRYLSPLPAMERVATEPLSGEWGHADTGEVVLLGFARANHDEAVFDAPADLDLERKPNRHLAFGNGPHTCIGLHLARVETRVFVEELLAAAPDWHLTSTPTITWGQFRGSQVPVYFGSLPVGVGR
jgi:cytochrome P450